MEIVYVFTTEIKLYSMLHCLFQKNNEHLENDEKWSS